MRVQKNTLCLGVLISLSAVNVADAQSRNIDADEIISTATRIDMPAASVAGNVDVISKQELRAVASTQFNEVAIRSAGVNFARNDGQEYLASIRSPIFTGAGACGAFLMAQDGIALRASGFCNVNELFEAHTEVAERVEITKGPGSSLYGSNAMHGIVNVITPTPTTNDGMASLEIGASDFVRVNAEKNWVQGNSGVFVGGTVTHDGGYREQSGYDQQKFSLRHDYTGAKWDINTNFTATNLQQETAGYITGFESYKDKDIAKTNPNPEAYRNATSVRLSSHLSTQLSEQTRLQIVPYARSLDMEFLMHFLPGQPLEKNSQNGVGVQTGLYINENSALSFIVGMDGEFTKGSLEQTQENPTLGSAFLMATIPSGKQYDYDVDAVMGAVFARAEWDASPRLHLHAGARLEYMHYDYTNNMSSGRVKEDGTTCGFGGCRYSRPESRKDSFTTLSPKLGLLYNVDDQTDLYVNLSTGFRAPQASELYRLQRAQSVADLDNVKLHNAEIGVRGTVDWLSGLSYDVSVYGMKKDNVIFRDASFFNVDNAKTSHIGADITLDYALSSQLNLRANLGLARHQYESDTFISAVNVNGLDIDSAPGNFGSMQLNWRPTNRFTGELEYVHMGSYFLDPENTSEYSGHDYFNVRGTLKLNRSVDVFARVLNFTNVKYAERADYTSFTDERYFPGRPRSFYIGVRSRF